MAFTQKDLHKVTDDVNAALNATMGEGNGTRYAATSRNGYYAVDIIGANGRCIRTAGTGTPRECQAELHAHAFWQLVEFNRLQTKG